MDPGPEGQCRQKLALCSPPFAVSLSIPLSSTISTSASLDLPVTDGSNTRLVDLIGDRGSDEPFETVFNLALQDTLQRVLLKLSRREMRIIKLRFGLDCEGPHSLEETGRLLGITRERVRQIQEKAISKLKNYEQLLELRDNWQ